MRMLTFYTAPGVWSQTAVCAAVYTDNAGDRVTASVGQLTQSYRRRLLVSTQSKFSALEVLFLEKKKRKSRKCNPLGCF